MGSLMLTSDCERETNPFAACQSTTEVVVALNAMHGLEAVEHLLIETASSREMLRTVADDVQRVGLIDLARLVRKYARKAKRGPLTFKTRWRTADRASGKLPGHIRHNYR